MKTLGSNKMDQDLVNDICKVKINRKGLTVQIGPWMHLIDVDQMKVVEVKPGQFNDYYSDLELNHEQAISMYSDRQSNEFHKWVLKEAARETEAELIYREAEFEIFQEEKRPVVVDIDEINVMIID